MVFHIEDFQRRMFSKMLKNIAQKVDLYNTVIKHFKISVHKP